MATYRRALQGDLPALLALSKEMHAETSFQALSFSDSKTATEILSAILNPNMLFVVAEDRGTIIGMIAAYLDRPYFSEDLVVYDHVWYVGKEGRGSMVGPRLLKCVSEWARLCGAKAVFVTLGSDVSQERVGKLVERLGYSRLGGYYRKDIDSVEV
jgi:N-acetylglutamate synthase-like GNAT family acetyltransferase